MSHNTTNKLVLTFLTKDGMYYCNTNGMLCYFSCVFKSISHTFDYSISGIVKPFFSSGLSSSPSTYTHGSIHNLYAMEFFFSLWVRFFNFLRFPSHRASKEHCVALPFTTFLSLSKGFAQVREKGLCHGPASVKTDITLSTTDRQLTSNIADGSAETAQCQ